MSAVSYEMYLQLLFTTQITASVLPSVRATAALESHRGTNSIVDCTCKGSRLCTLSHPETTPLILTFPTLPPLPFSSNLLLNSYPSHVKNCLPWDQSLVPKRLESAALVDSELLEVRAVSSLTVSTVPSTGPAWNTCSVKCWASRLMNFQRLSEWLCFSTLS